MKNHDRGKKRERNGDAGNRGAAHVREKKKKHDSDEDRAEDEGNVDVVRGDLDEIRGAENARENFHMFAAQQRRHLVERVLDAARRFERVRAVLRPDVEDDAGLSIHRCVADRRRGGVDDTRDVAERDVARWLMRDDNRRDVARIERAAFGAQNDALIFRVDESRAAKSGRAPRGVVDVIDRQLVMQEALGNDLHLHLTHVAAPRAHFCDAGDRQKSRRDRPVGDRAKLHPRQLIGGESDRQQIAGR